MSRRSHWGLLLASSLCFGAAAMHNVAAAADARSGRAKSQPCSVCHGANGLSTLPDAPNLAGQPEIYLSNQLRAYRSGERRHEVMSLVAKALSDDDIADLAAWFASIRVEATPPD
jgi:cytochrome c553